MTPSPHWSTLPHAPAPGIALLCQRDALPDGQATLWQLDTGGGPGKAFKLLLLRSGLQVTAFVNRCAHYARYRLADGGCDTGECDGEGLIPVPLHIADDGSLSIAAEDR